MNSSRPKLSTLPHDLLSLADYARLARDYIDAPVWEWLEGGSGGLQALEANAAAYRQISVYNRLLVNCRNGSTRTRLLGHDLDHPILLAPLGYHRLVHPEGEIATARGCLDTPLVASSMASTSLEDMARAAAGPLWFQLYFQPKREQTKRLIEQAEAAGCTAIMVTLDTPIQPQGHAAQKAGFVLPSGVEAVNLRGLGSSRPLTIGQGDSLIFQGMMAQAPQWADIDWLREQTSLPILAKGVSHPDDARALIAAGLDGIVLSNHGGRSLEAAPAPLAVLGAVRAALGPDVPILIDGAIRTGADIFKALALGANAVMVGRPQLHALAVAGSLGVAHMLKLLRDDLELVMALAGCSTIASITADALCPAHSGLPKE